MWHVIGSQGDDIGGSTLELAYQQVFILVSHLHGCRFGGVIELLERVFGNFFGRDMVSLQELAKCLAERLGGGEEHTALADGIAFHEVEVAVGMCPVVIVQAVAAQSTEQGDVLDLGDIG